MAETERNFHVRMWFEGGTTASIQINGIKGTQLYRVLRNAKANKKSFMIKPVTGKPFKAPPGLLRYEATEMK
jgi:hypothetical protein